MSAFEWVNTGASIFSALGTVGAFAVGGVVLMRDRRVTAEQRADAAVRAENDRRRQASFVTGWAVSSTSPHYDSQVIVMNGPTKIQYNVLNGSDGPISDVAVYAPNELNAPRSNVSLGFILPGGKSSSDQPDTSDNRSSDFSVPQPIPIFFTDTRGTRWFRDGRGALYEWSDEVETRLSEPWAIVEPEAGHPGLHSGSPAGGALPPSS